MRLERGFAVVSQEIKKLADKTSGETNKIDELLRNIHDEIDRVKGANQKIKNAVDEGLAISETVNASIEDITNIILQNNKTDSSQIIAVNYNYKKNKLLNFNDIIVSPPIKNNSWNDILGLNDTHYSFTSDDVYTSPAMSYRGLLLSTPFDRLFDRKMYQTDKNIPKIRWKWWKPEFWEFKLQQL